MSTQTRERDQYDDDGYSIYRQVIDADLIREASDHVDWLLANNPGIRPEQLHNNLMTNDPFWVRLVADDRLLDVAQQYVGPDIALFASHYICKPSGDGQPVLWHQDGSYWPLEPMDVVTLWLAVDDSDVDNGCMRVIPGTQSTELQEMQQNQEVDNVLGSSIDPQYLDESAAVDIVLAAGDVSVHHPNIIHGSNANTSQRRRCGLTIRYIPATTRILTDGQWPSAFLLRGSAVDSVNDYLPWPTYLPGEHMSFRESDQWPPSVPPGP